VAQCGKKIKQALTPPIPCDILRAIIEERSVCGIHNFHIIMITHFPICINREKSTFNQNASKLSKILSFASFYGHAALKSQA
jgi:hypothetical protein